MSDPFIQDEAWEYISHEAEKLHKKGFSLLYGRCVAEATARYLEQAIFIDGVEYSSQAHAARVLKLTRQRISSKMQSAQKENSKLKPILVDGVRFDRISWAAEEIGCHQQTLRKSLRRGDTELRGRKIAYANKE